MKDFMICILATMWVIGVIFYMGPKRQAVYRRVYPRAHDEHGAGRFSQDIIDQADRAHRGGHIRCPVHGAPCGRAKAARETGMSHTDEDVARRAAINGTR